MYGDALSKKTKSSAAPLLPLRVFADCFGARRAGLLVGLLACLFAGGIQAYDGKIHKQLTFIAAQGYNHCADGRQVPRLSPLQVRYIAKANQATAEGSVWRRMFRWNYYDRSGGESDGRMLRVVETRMHSQFQDAMVDVDQSVSMGDQFSSLGRIVSFLQDATTPSAVVPVYTLRWWRIGAADRFNHYPVDVAAVLAAAIGDCSPLRISDMGYERLLDETAARTINAVLDPIADLPVSWEVFWEFDADDPTAFGQYGQVGNSFGREVTLACAQGEGRTSGKRKKSSGNAQCALEEDDPAYHAFALARHVEAVRATMTAMAAVQTRIQNRILKTTGTGD